MIIAGVEATLAVKKKKPESNSGLYGIGLLYLCDADSAFYQLN